MTAEQSRPLTAEVSEELDHIPVYDVTIIGGGPVGLFGAFYAGIRQMHTKIVDSLPELGGQLSALYPEKFIYDMPGFPKVLAKDLVRDMAEQGLRFNPAVCLDEKVLHLQHEDDGTITVTTQKAVHRTKTMIVATGAGAFSPKKLATPGVTEFEGRGIHYFVRNKSQFEGKRLLIVGGGDSALDWAMNLEEVGAKHITLIHRSDKFRAHEASMDWLLNSSKVDVKMHYELAGVQGDDLVKCAIVFNNQTKEEICLDVDAVLLNIGFSADLGPIRDWGVELDGNSIPVNQFMETNLQGVYAAGDIATYPGKLKLIATGVGDICIAVNYAKTRIDPNAKAFPGHSSNLELPNTKPVAE